MKEKILITLATGTTGYAITRQLLSEGYPVRIYVRSRNRRAMELEVLGAEICIGAFDSYDQFLAALVGVKKAYYCYPMMKGMPQSIQLFIKAAREAELYAVVFMGQWLAEYDDASSILTKDIQVSYKLLEESGIHVVYYNPGFFADNVISFTESVAQMGLMPSPFGHGKCAWISTGDLGRCAVALLKNPEPYFGKKVHPTGPKAITADEMAAIYAKVAGRRVKILAVSDNMFMKAVMAAAKEFGYDAFVAVQTVFYMQELRKDRFGEHNSVVRELTGRDAENFETVVRQFFAESPYSKRSFRGKIHAIGSFLKLLLAKAPNKYKMAALNA